MGRRASLMKLALLALAWVCGAQSGRAVAQPTADAAPADVDAMLAPCVPVDAAQFERLLHIELGTSARHAESRGAAGAAPTRVEVHCVPDGYEVRLQDGVTRKSMRRVLPAAPLQGSAGPRLLALAVAEFVVASWTELTLPPPPVEPVGPKPDARQQRGAREAARRRLRPAPEPARPPAPLHWGAGAGLTFLPGQVRTVLPGARLRMGLRAGPLRFASDLSAAYGVEAVDPGRLRMFLGSIAGLVGLATTTRRSELVVGLGGRIGMVALAGEAVGQGHEGRSDAAPWAEAFLRFGSYYVPSTELRLGLEASVGWVTWPVRVRSEDEGTLVALDALSLGLDFVVDFNL